MKVLCAPDSFKETLAAYDAARAMAAGVRLADPTAECDVCPLGDGGEGTLAALAPSLKLEMVQCNVCGPLGSPVPALFGVCTEKRLGIVELAQASGLTLVPAAQRNPMHTTTYGTGEVIVQAMQRGCQEVIVCVGGSATVDGGTGIAQALGVRFFDRNQREIPPPIAGKNLHQIARIDMRGLKGPRRVRVACDVTNPLCGPHGAALTYGAQKGASPQQQIELDAALRHFAEVCRTLSSNADPNAIGAGAAGGAAFGLLALCNATLERGIDLVLDAVSFTARCRGASFVLTGEGRLDSQSLHGKVCLGVAASAAMQNVPTIAIVGSTGPGADDCTNPAKGGPLKQYISLADRFGLERAVREPAQLIQEISREIASRFNTH